MRQLIAVLLILLPLAGAAQAPDPCAGPLPSFSSGPYGRNARDLAADFTVPTVDGDWTYSARWNGCDSLVFVNYHPSYQYAVDLWASSVDDLIDGSPGNVQYFFCSFQTNATLVRNDVLAMKARVDAALGARSAAEQAAWAPRFHYVTTGAFQLPNWIGAKMQARGVFSWAIDRAQRVRDVGLLFHPGGPGVAELAYTAHETRHYNAERERDRALAARPWTTVTAFANAAAGTVSADVSFPTPAEIAMPDTLLLDLTLDCPGHDEANCGEWDYIVNLMLCEPGNSASCPVELGRWITTYGREGRWITDATPFLPLLAAGGVQTLRFVSGQVYDMTLRLHFGHTGRGERPVAMRSLWTGGGFDQNYSSRHPPQVVHVSSAADRVLIAALLTGHGWGVELDNCAEFCNHQHRFTVNGVPFQLDHPEAGIADGCIRQIENGVVPNQYGTWPFGRGGWCPGLDVAPRVLDITSAVRVGANTITYEGLFNNAPYVPRPDPNPPGGFPATIALTSWLVQVLATHEETDCANGVDDDGDGPADCDDTDCVGDPACAGADTDGDGEPNATDCAPADPGSRAVPGEVAPLMATHAGGDDARLSWPDPAIAWGADTVVDVASGTIASLRADRGTASATMPFRDVRLGVTDGRPPGGDRAGFWYLVRARNACGAGPLGDPDLDARRPFDEGPWNCADGEDNDADGLTDCADPACTDDPACPEDCSNASDDDADGAVDCADTECIGHAACPETGNCADDLDNDTDGAVDCDDPDCDGDAACGEGDRCADGRDNDGDTLIDCADLDCQGDPACPESGDAACTNLFDDDGDTLVDCADPDCATAPACIPPVEDCAVPGDEDGDGAADCDDDDCDGPGCAEVGRCADGRDNDGDTLVDCQDPDCSDDVACPENCTNGADDDADGQVDCADAECVGAPACLEAGNCSDATDNDGDTLVDCQDLDCSDDAACPENCTNGADDDADGLVDCADAECASFPACAEAGNCGDATDNDGDTLVDCQDPDCSDDAGCPENCTNGADDDADGQVDCADSECAGAPTCLETGNCSDATDNDGDTLVDCQDPDCSDDAGCPENCTNGADDDADGQVDCADSECAGLPACLEAANCSDGQDNDGDTLVDCQDPDCTDDPACPENCTNGVDDDADNNADCRDSECAAHPACQEVGRCADGLDNDADTLVDCDDPDCSDNIACPEDCFNGVDDDANGLVDCADTDCASEPACDESTQCADAADNDGDTLVDCDDPDCSFMPECPEICDNGIDDDANALVDCEDPDCGAAPNCYESDCSDGIDNDGDGFTDCADLECFGEPGC